MIAEFLTDVLGQTCNAVHRNSVKEMLVKKEEKHYTGFGLSVDEPLQPR